MSEIDSGERDELAALVEAAREGSREAFDQLVRRTYVDTYTLAVRLTGNEEDARDVAQEAYLRAWKGIRRFRGDSQFTTWMYRITANASYSYVEKRGRTRATNLDDVEEPTELRLEHRPADAVEAAAGFAELTDALEHLSPKLRQIVILKDVYGLPHEAIAEDLGISVAATKVRLHRGRKRLRDLLYDESSGRSAHAV
jgi:RNA polymerase sigma-70 factor (ECF subfamily)